MKADDLDFEHEVEVYEGEAGEHVAACTCGWWEAGRNESNANDLAGAHHSETTGR